MGSTSFLRAYDSVLSSYWPALLVLVIAVIVRSNIWLNADVSLLLTLGERVLAGARAYVDFSETNPPASILLYLPAIYFGQLIALPAELVLTVFVFAAAVASCWLVARILSSSALLSAREEPLLAALALCLLLILPGDNFAEREHFALLAMLPMLAIYAARASDIEPDTVLAVISGLAAGVAVAIKPYFALPFAFAFPYVCWSWLKHRRTLFDLLFAPEHLAAIGVVALYGWLLVSQFASYLRDTLPLVLELYVPLKYSLPLMLTNPSVILVAMTSMVASALGWRKFRKPQIAVAALAVLGYSAALIIQGKGWPYHGYPADALALLTLAMLLVRRAVELRDEKEKFRSLTIDLGFGAGLLIAVYVAASVWQLQEHNRAKLVEQVARLVPPHPRIVAIDGGPSVAFPLTRRLHGTLLGRTPFQWITAFTDRWLASGGLDPNAGRSVLDAATRRRLEEYGRKDRLELADTIRRGHPDVILIGDDIDRRWAFSHAEIAESLKSYHQVESVDGVYILLPRKTAAQRAP